MNDISNIIQKLDNILENFNLELYNLKCILKDFNETKKICRIKKYIDSIDIFINTSEHKKILYEVLVTYGKSIITQTQLAMDLNIPKLDAKRLINILVIKEDLKRYNSCYKVVDSYKLRLKLSSIIEKDKQQQEESDSSDLTKEELEELALQEESNKRVEELEENNTE